MKASFQQAATSVRSRRILFINTYYDQFLGDQYRSTPGLDTRSYAEQKQVLLSACFGDSDYYSRGISAAGWQADDLIVNAPYLQLRWAVEHGCTATDSLGVMLEQIRTFQPDVVYLQDLSLATEAILAAIRPHVRLICGQIASPLPAQTWLDGLDICFSSLPHFVTKFRQQGVTAYYQPLAFEPRILQQLPQHERRYPLTFIGGISPHHGKGLETLEKIAAQIQLDLWGYGAGSLADASAVRRHHHGEAWGLAMFSLLASSRITLNRHIDVAENFANNMRLFEATGCGALLLTDYRDNLAELFEIGREVVAYRTPDEAVLLARYYLQHPEEAAAIAKAGQERTLRDHTYSQRMQQTAGILERHLRYLDERDQFPAVDFTKISYDYRHLQQVEVTEAMQQGWQDSAIPFRQRALVQHELQSMYHGKTPQPYQVLAELLQPVIRPGLKLLEIGCASGYYSEVIEYLLSQQVDYTGVDYADAMIAMARQYYPDRTFLVADGAALPFADQSFELVLSGSVLLHTVDYPEQIAETARVAKNRIIVHRTPTCRIRRTQHYAKAAYGVQTVELRFNEQELLDCFQLNGFELENSLIYHASDERDEYEVSYLLQRTAPTPVAASRERRSSTCPKPTERDLNRRGPVVLISRPIAFTFPLSYAYLAGQLRRQGDEVVVLFKEGSPQELVRQIMELNPVLVGLGSLYPELAETRSLIQMLDAAGRRFPVVIGGQMVSPTPEFSVRITGADYGVIGEGELILAELVTRLRSGRDVADLKGLVVRDGDSIINNGPGAFIEDITHGLPPVPYDLFPVEQWLPIGAWYAKHLPQPQWQIDDRVINVHGGRGCPFTCNFCYHHSKPRYRDIDVMMAEAQQGLQQFNANMLYFSDDLVLATPKRAARLIDAIAQLDRPISFQVSTRFDILARMDTGLLRELKRVGCRSMGLGLESGSDRILQIIGKNCSVQQIEDGLERLHDVGIYPTTSIMLGQYTETLEDAAASIALMRRAVQRDPCINFAFTLTTPFPGSQLHNLIFEKGLLKDEQEFYDRYFATAESDFKQVVNLSAMSDVEVMAARYEIERVYFEEKKKQSGHG